MKALSAVSALLVAGCMVPGDEWINDSTVQVQTVHVTMDLARNGLMYRCASLTVEHGYDLMLLQPIEKEQKGESYRPAPWLGESMPFGWYAKQNTLSNENANPDWRPRQLRGPYKPITLLEGGVVVTMYRRPLPDNLLAAIDARKLKESIQPFYDSKGQATLPEMWKLVRQSTVTHVQITMPTGDLIHPTPADGPAPLSGAGTELRDASEFVDQFEAAEATMYSLFEQRRFAGGASGGGTVILSLTVTPGGVVSESRVVSSTVADPIFTESLRRMAARFNFFREEVAATKVGWYPIVFTPRRE